MNFLCIICFGNKYRINEAVLIRSGWIFQAGPEHFYWFCYPFHTFGGEKTPLLK